MGEVERRNTRQRRAVQEALAATPDFVSAQDLHARMRSGGDSIGLATVYRTLSTLAEDERVDILRTPEGEARYRQCSTDEHHHHLVCRECGLTVEVDGPAVEEWAEQTGRQHGFTGITHTVEVFGTCDDCAKGHATALG
ncbi:Fur family ferric uptake transcriptional regulator [Kineosphaera limosa]|uniref:Putative Fur family transcriptional regulator n=1 Tax=Kineosphaera limosa NBRC 100340 TaxID=1184609 RepID=K6WMG4_9MICO|nr:transcriptional repressor [Kineosphaera limosa]NYE00543.1 Fur family ferric uptake transcriptional regulator [Kineosphaera limosa]GAB94991.1 putative Fur family transcriptional regulator [Kineosphaera limosa NBRC 100340]